MLVDPETGRLYLTVGYPPDGREYGVIEPMSDVRGERVVWFEDTLHRWGYAISHPLPGEHIARDWPPEQRSKDWPLSRRSRYWLYVIPDPDMPAYLRGERPTPLLVQVDHAWTVPEEIADSA